MTKYLAIGVCVGLPSRGSSNPLEHKGSVKGHCAAGPCIPERGEIEGARAIIGHWGRWAPPGGTPDNVGGPSFVLFLLRRISHWGPAFRHSRLDRNIHGAGRERLNGANPDPPCWALLPGGTHGCMEQMSGTGSGCCAGQSRRVNRSREGYPLHQVAVGVGGSAPYRGDAISREICRGISTMTDGMSVFDLAGRVISERKKELQLIWGGRDGYTSTCRG